MTELISEAENFLKSTGYLPQNLLREYRFTWRSDEGYLRNDRTDLVAFSDAPHTMKTACVGVFEAPSENAAQDSLRRLTFLSPPAAIVGTPDTVTLWGLRREKDPEPVIRANRKEWLHALSAAQTRLGPDVLSQAKWGVQSYQMHFVDIGIGEWAERITSAALVTLLESLLTETLTLVASDVRRTKAGSEAVLRLVFHLFACRVLEDRGVIASSDDVEQSLEAASERFSENIDPGVLHGEGITERAVQYVHGTLQRQFAFASLTATMLGHAYENALVTPAFRKNRGIYYTPAALTDYVLSRTPVESIPEKDRRVLDPACGSGSFLLAAYDRLSSLLSRGLSSAARHQYLRARLQGFDIDAFAREMAVLSLLLTDVENRNGWEIQQKDLFTVTPDAIGKRRPTIIVTNPPFGERKHAGTRRELAAEAASHLLTLLAPGGFLGIVLPLSIADSKAGANARRAILEECDLIELLTLPEGLFHSKVETLTLIARKREGKKVAVPVTTIRELKSRDLSRFIQSSVFTRTYSADLETWRRDRDAKFVISPLLDLWQRLEGSHERLGNLAAVRAGLKVKATDQTSVHDDKQPGDVPFIDRKDLLKPYALLSKGEAALQWLTYGQHLERPRTPETFAPAKVLVNSNRNPGSPWRLVAAKAPAGLYYSFSFHGLVPAEDSNVSLEFLVAILNSPVANAWFDAHSRKRWIHIPTLERLPVPKLDTALAERVRSRVRLLEQETMRKWRGRTGRSRTLLDEDEGETYGGELAALIAELDEIVFTAYGLTTAETRAVQKLMIADKRPGQ